MSLLAEPLNIAPGPSPRTVKCANSEPLDQHLATQSRRGAQHIPLDAHATELTPEIVALVKVLLLASMHSLELPCNHVQLRQSLPPTLPTCVHMNLPRGPRLLTLGPLAGPLG